MKAAYPVIFKDLKDGWFMASVPDFEIDTQGNGLAETIEMARDAIGLMGIDMEDDKKELPTPSGINTIKCNPGEYTSLVDVDFTAYRKANERRTIRRNVSLPSWLNDAAEKAGLNVSAILQSALKQELQL